MGKLAFKTIGGEGEDIVLIHGFGSDRLSWLGNSPALMALGRVHALDLPGHGESDTEVGDGVPQSLMRAVATALDDNNIARAHLVGHSLGGGLSLLLAAETPERVQSLTLIVPVGLGRGIDHDYTAALPKLADLDAALTALRRLVARPQLINKMTAQRVLAQLSRDGARAALTTIAEQLAAHEPDFARAAQTVASRPTPRLTIWGDSDAINPIDMARTAAFGGRLLIVPDAAHLPHIENPKLVNERLVSFLQEAMRG